MSDLKSIYDFEAIYTILEIIKLIIIWNIVYILCATCIGSWLALNVTFWGLNAVLLYNDMTGNLPWLMKYKVQEDTGAWVI